METNRVFVVNKWANNVDDMYLVKIMGEGVYSLSGMDVVVRP